MIVATMACRLGKEDMWLEMYASFVYLLSAASRYEGLLRVATWLLFYGWRAQYWQRPEKKRRL